MRIPVQSIGQRRSIFSMIKTKGASTESSILPQNHSPFALDLDLVARPTCQQACSACNNENIPLSQRLNYYCPICYGSCGGFLFQRNFLG